jgi:tetratricopeptide (TPR) repeat protein
LKALFPKSLGFAHYIFAVVLVVRLIVLTRLTLSPFLLPLRGDMHFYDDWAQRILQGHLTDHLAFYGLPLYAYVLALIYKLAGYGPFVPGLLQALCEAGTAVIIYKLGVRIFPPVAAATDSKEQVYPVDLPERQRGNFVGIIAALGWAFFMPAQAYAPILMPTVWLVFIFWLLVWLVVRNNSAPNRLACLGFGFLVGFAAMAVATVLFLVPLLLGAIFSKPARAASHSQIAKIVAAALLFLGIGIGTSPCWLHNYFVARDPVLLSAHGGVNFWIGNNPIATGYPRFPPGLHAGQEAMLKDSIKTAEKAVGHPLKRSEVSAFWSAKAKNYIRHHFGAWVKLLVTKINNFWNAFQYDDLSMISALREHGVIWPTLRFGVISALALPGLLLAFRQFPLSRWVAGAIALQMLSLLSVFVTERYRLAAVPGLLLFAAFGATYLWQACLTANFRHAVAYLLVLAVATWFVSVPKHDPSLWALDSYNSGWQALESNDLALAEAKLNLAHAYVPDNAETNFALGNLRLARNDQEAAKSYYLVALHLDPNHEGAYNNLGVIALTEKRWRDAEGYFRGALKQEEQDAKTHYLLAKTFCAEGNWRAAQSAIERALALNPTQPEFITLRDEIRKSEQP